MSKMKQARLHLKKDEILIKKGMMDYCLTGGYGHAVQGDSTLTNTRFYFGAELKTGAYYALEIPLVEINEVKKTGIPFLTRSLLIVADGRRYRFNVFPRGGWIKAICRAVADVKK